MKVQLPIPDEAISKIKKPSAPSSKNNHRLPAKTKHLQKSENSIRFYCF